MNDKTPRIRFKGFTDDWEQRKLGDVIEKLTGGASITPDDYVDVGYRTIPKGAVNSSGVADMSGCKNVSEYFFKKNISSKTSSGELVTSLRDLVPTAPNMGRIVRICGETEDFLMPQGVYSIIVKEKISEDFLISYSNSLEYRKIIMAEKNGSTQVHIRNGEFLNIDIPLPSYEEQKKVGDYFRSLDNLITLHQRKCEVLVNIKKSMLEKIFPKNGKKVPEIRFEGFTDDWEQRKFSDVIDIGSGMDYKYLGEGNIPVYGTGGYMLSVNKALSYDKDAIGIGRKGTIDKPYILRAPFWTVDTLFYCIPKEHNNLDFINCIFQNVDWKKKDESTGVPSLSKVIINNVETAIPTFDEQQKIGAYFSELDHLITLHQRKLEKLQNIKKSMLEQMFI